MGVGWHVTSRKGAAPVHVTGNPYLYNIGIAERKISIARDRGMNSDDLLAVTDAV